ncbi:MAG: YeeE/YedE family protein [Limimaricola sp.]|nr:YeeE/YedE family protein [Limimaricola sp.]
MPTAWAIGALGGLMIGLAAASFLLINGRIMGASGILGGLIDGSGQDNPGERTAFLAGLIGVPALLVALGHDAPMHLTGNVTLLAIAGLLVGVGTRMANGCTSGHGVVGIARLSIRGIVATLAYLLAGFITMAVGRHVLGII